MLVVQLAKTSSVYRYVNNHNHEAVANILKQSVSGRMALSQQALSHPKGYAP